MNSQSVQLLAPKIAAEQRGQWHTLRVVVASLAMVLVVAVVDYVTGSEVSVTLLSLAPICWSAWFANRNAVVFVAVACALTWLAVDQLERASVGQLWVGRVPL